MGDIIDVSDEASVGGLRLCYPVSASALAFKVRPNQQLKAEISLLQSANRPHAAYKVILRSNDPSLINEGHTVVKQQLTPDLLSTEEWREFWITWHHGRIRVGYAGNSAPFLEANMSDGPLIKYVMLTSDAQWKLELGPVRPRRVRVGGAGCGGAAPVWVEADDGRPPVGAIIGGYEHEPLTIIRAPYEGSLTPGKFVPSQGAFIGRDWHMHPRTVFEALVGYNVGWVEARGGEVPARALPGGHAETSRETLYVARAHHEGHLALGKVHPSHGCAYITYQGKEIRKPCYEVLVCRSMSDPRAVAITSRLAPLAMNYDDDVHQSDESEESSQEEDL